MDDPRPGGMKKAPKRVVHRAGQIRSDGAVSARCFKRPRPIDMKRASWTTTAAGVTCPRCKALETPPA